ncbi:hypothetical protein J2R98_002229 [Alkalibacillus filiformis]|uniref:LytR family transcriptional regulator n=1 Tax=Alkalibacillus filiformis TaxID=200990 RepID=A0ABU0DVK6_9BACI|nr:LytR family transcriptional regulator [Alkalibacillus filiformis]MDQ0352385.1 hypothetical protein [Alkalibacillus filiformis]
MKHFKDLPKSVKKTIRYIHQDIETKEQLESVEKQLKKVIEKKREELDKDEK